MNRLAQEAVIVGLTRRLGDKGSWSGETHIQKTAYLLHGLTNMPFDFEFILYKHGPFSFELRDELTSMRSDGLVDRQAQAPPYGPRILATDRGRELEARFSKTMGRYGRQLDWIAGKVCDRGVMDLERLATALWVTRRLGGETSVGERAEALNELKPHVSVPLAAAAVEEIDRLIAESGNLVV